MAAKAKTSPYPHGKASPAANRASQNQNRQLAKQKFRRSPSWYDTHPTAAAGAQQVAALRRLAKPKPASSPSLAAMRKATGSGR